MSDRRLHLWVASGHVGSTRRPNERWLLSVLTVVMPTCFVVHQLASLVVGTRGCNSRCTMWWKQKSTQEGIIPSYRCVTSFFAAHTIGWTIRYASFWLCFFKEWSRLRAEQMVGGTVKKKKEAPPPHSRGPDIWTYNTNQTTVGLLATESTSNNFLSSYHEELTISLSSPETWLRR